MGRVLYCGEGVRALSRPVGFPREGRTTTSTTILSFQRHLETETETEERGLGPLTDAFYAFARRSFRARDADWQLLTGVVFPRLSRSRTTELARAILTDLRLASILDEARTGSLPLPPPRATAKDLLAVAALFGQDEDQRAVETAGAWTE